jgi:hypothetical protein
MMNKTPNLSAEARAQIAQTLPVALEKAIACYQGFIDGHDNDEVSSEYKNKQNAAKAGLAHIELLMKLANMVDALDGGQADNILQLINEAKDELEGFNE